MPRHSKPITLDWSIFTISDVRHLLQLKAKFIRAGLPLSNPLYIAFDGIRDAYIKSVGFRSYVSQMLGPFGDEPCGECQFYDEARGRIYPHLSRGSSETVRDLLKRQPTGVRGLPFIVRCGGRERYL